MPSSGNTPSPRDSGPLRLFLLLAGEDHPKACTGRHLLRLGLVQELKGHPARGRPPLLLDPHADRPLSPSDRPWVERSGLLAVDCSWNRLRDRGGYPADRTLSGLRERRRLPWLLAANPQHFGRLTELNTAEALAAATFILGSPKQSERLLEGLRGARAFFEINGAALRAFARASDAPSLEAEEVRLYGGTSSR